MLFGGVAMLLAGGRVSHTRVGIVDVAVVCFLVVDVCCCLLLVVVVVDCVCCSYCCCCV